MNHTTSGLLDENMTVLSGLTVALTTPFDTNDNIDKEYLVEHVRFLARENVRSLLVAGTTGEFFSLSDSERRSILTLVRHHFSGQVLFNAGAEGLGRTRELVLCAQECAADGVVIIAPYYFANCTSDGLIAYLRQIVALTSLPLVLYNFPRHTQNPLNAQILDSVPHAALKDSSADLSLIAHTPAYFLGNDRLVVSAYEKGAKGFVTGVANAEPGPYVALELALEQKDFALAAALQQEVTNAAQRYHGIEQISLIKKAISRQVPGYPQLVRAPLV